VSVLVVVRVGPGPNLRHRKTDVRRKVRGQKGERICRPKHILPFIINYKCAITQLVHLHMGTEYAVRADKCMCTYATKSPYMY